MTTVSEKEESMFVPDFLIWRCAGCGKPAKGKEKPCDCATNVGTRPGPNGGLEQTWWDGPKSDQDIKTAQRIVDEHYGKSRSTNATLAGDLERDIATALADVRREALEHRLPLQSGEERQSKYNRLKFAEGLIQQLPPDHDGRNTWLLNYGQSNEAQERRKMRGIQWDEETAAAKTVSSARSKP